MRGSQGWKMRVGMLHGEAAARPVVPIDARRMRPGIAEFCRKV